MSNFVPVKKLLALFLLIIYLFSTTEFVQLLKIPVLVSHFIEHQEENPDTTFIGFIVEHYGGHEKDADWETDMKLPFMQHSDLLHIVGLPSDLCFDITKPRFLINSEGSAHYNDDNLPNSYLSTIWQPPKI